jgi:CRP-like cAMP-binding protein
MVANSFSERLRMELIRLAESGTRDGLRAIIDPAPTHYELAAVVGSHREAVTKELGRLEALGEIVSKRGHITILNIEKFIEGGSAFTP